MTKDQRKPQFTRHGLRRAAQRGIRQPDIEMIWASFDRSTPVGSDCDSLVISRSEAARLIAEGAPREAVERAARVAVVVCGTSLITCLRPGRSKAGRRYLRAWQRNHRRYR